MARKFEIRLAVAGARLAVAGARPVGLNRSAESVKRDVREDQAENEFDVDAIDDAHREQAKGASEVFSIGGDFESK